MKVRKLLLPYTWGFGRFLLTILLGIFCFSLLSPAYSRQRDEEMIVAVLENWPPQYSIDPETKKPTGFAIDIFEQLARRLNIKIKYKVYHSWPEIMEAFEKGEIDIIPNLGITSERSDLYDFTTSVETFQIRIFVRDTTFTINSIGDLQKYRVGAVKSNKGLFLLESQKVKNIHVYNSLKEAFGGLLSGAVDALVYPEPPVLKLAYQSKLEDKIKTIGQPLLEVKRAIAVKKGNPELVATLNRALDDLKKTSAYRKIYRRWYGAPDPFWTVMKVLSLMIALTLCIAMVLATLHYRSIVRLNRELENQVIVRKKTEESLKQAQHTLEKTNKDLQTASQHWQATFDAVSDYVCVISPEHEFIKVNRAVCEATGLAVEELIGKKCYHIIHGTDRPIKECPYMETLRNEVSGTSEYSEKGRHYKLSAWPVLDKFNKLVSFTHIVEDITDRKQAEEQLKVSLKEKETLLDEIHHRVKNNMAVIASLLNLQSDSIEDNQIKEILKVSQNRVYAMSVVHEILHGSDNLSEIDLKTYLHKVTSSIFQTYSINPDKAKLNISIEEIPISIDQATPLGLIINELLSNSLKYAFPDERKGGINVSMKKLENELELTIMDDGVGIPDGLDWKNSNTLGLKLVRTLVENQLDGSIDMESNNGTKFTIKFNLDRT